MMNRSRLFVPLFTLIPKQASVDHDSHDELPSLTNDIEEIMC